jgi:methylated-DNA-[protein]-cysteine S-methyltransferase
MYGYFYKIINSPIGNIYLVSDNTHLRAVIYEKKRNDFQDIFKNASAKENSLINIAELQLAEYFNRQRKTFDLPFYFDGTDFQIKAWNSLIEIPYGTTISYLEQAQIAGNIKAVRAIGHANSLNPISIIIPCHRVIGKSGKLIGYGGGLDSKQYLISLEQN